MTDMEFHCSVWNAEEQLIEEGPHGEVDTIVLKDAYFVAGEISQHMPEGQYVHEKDVEMVDFTVDVSGDEVTEEDVSSEAASYLEKFPGVYEGVAGYVENLDRVPAERFQCPHCENYLAEADDIDR